MQIGPAANAQNCPDKLAIVFGDRRYTWREWNARINQQRPRSVDFVEEVPRNPSGKLLKRELRQRYWGENGRRI